MCDEQWIARSPPDDLQSKIVDCDPFLENFEARAVGGIDRGPPRDGVPAGGRGVHRRVERVSVNAAALPTLVVRAIALDDLGDPRSQVSHRRERRSATASRTSLPRA